MEDVIELTNGDDCEKIGCTDPHYFVVCEDEGCPNSHIIHVCV